MLKPFKFKQFSIQQDKTAMKVGTDGVLLGSWVEINSTIFNVLDIGSGTGLIALMLAQRSNAEVIDAIELNDEAYEQTVENFENSEWSDRLFCYHASFQEFVTEIDDKYELIVSNPPFYTSTYKELSEERAMARHSQSLKYNELLEGTAKLISEKGSCAFIIPYTEETNFIDLAMQHKLYLNRITKVKGTVNSPIKRSLMQFSFSPNQLEESELTIELERHNYTQEYIDLVKDFYLKM
ncbi:tRNA1(Val) (adenine(37)-N6)-methyltransferase [Lutibacter sp. B1]|uniref:tRNA1(Val) (adenine(37)-N6)-methyltransferase n=1 Tax=Lutibacter sp. B1 TaxID=2725996 RepID=UPI0014576BAF|nr:methyltransferase [Lutibacter sp. B1]NLP58875.1 methyltransferase [Lutibacter sp. B1]